MTAAQPQQDVGMLAGAICWTLTIAYLAVQPVVAAAWEPPYDITTNTISDLGVTECGDVPQIDDRVVFVCSPRHALMNTVFIAVGILTGAGAVLTRRVWPRHWLSAVGMAFIVLAGIGGVLVGLAPANVDLAVHIAGAALQVPGAVAPLLLGLAAWRGQRRIAVFSVLCGVIGSVASVLFISQRDLGLGFGVMERLAFDPLTVWTTVLGVVFLGRWLAVRRAER